MRKMCSVIQYEYKMQMRHIATWVIFIAATIIALLDSFPSALNLERLEFLPQPSYFVYRIMSIYALLLAFGLIFLLSNRFRIDEKTGVKTLFMVAPIKKAQYIAGKLLAGFIYTFSVMALFLILNTAIYAIFSPTTSIFADYLVPIGKTLLVSVLPVSFFISFCSVALPVIIDFRLYYFGISALFILNAITVGSAEKMPFYLITSGDLIKLIWQHPKYPFNDMQSILTNLLFLIVCGLAAWILLACKKKFWRSE